jgi:hypothetical protein
MKNEIEKIKEFFKILNDDKFEKSIRNFDISKIDKIIMFHEINDNIINILKENQNYLAYAVFTFDDGLYSQYYYFDKINDLFPNNPKIFFISTDIIYTGFESQIINISCYDAHKKYFTENNKQAYMTLSQIKSLNKKNNCYIGGHGHKHLHAINCTREPLKIFCKNWINDFITMKEKFTEYKLYNIKIFCTPYNEENIILNGLLKRVYNGYIIGKQRIAIEDIEDIK